MSDDQILGKYKITASIIRSYLISAAEEMRRTLIRTAFNPVIYDVLDFGISIYNDNLDLIAEATGIPFFIGANDYAIKKAVDYINVENLDPGDVLIMNYPYWNSAHTLDVTLFAPVFYKSKLVAYECIRAHWMDLGAKDPGYVLDSTDMHQEGIIFPSTKVCKRGELNKEIIEIIRFNSRMPDVVLGDLNAQIAAVRTGERRIRQTIEKFGIDLVKECIDLILNASEKKTLEVLSDLPKGSWTATDYLDDDGINEELIKMTVNVTITNKDFTVDFTGSSPAVKGPVNMPFGATQSICRTVFKSLTTPYEPSNAGHFRPLRVIAPPRTLFHAIYPSATFTLWTGMVALELVYKALSVGLTDRVSASSGGDVPGFMMVGKHPDTGNLYALSNNEPIGWGACSWHDGANALQHRSSSVVRNTPIEILELRTAMLIERMELATDSGGAGKYRGGLGVVREITFTGDGELITVMKKTKTRPWSLAGGCEPQPSRMYLFIGTEKERQVGTYRVSVKKGDRCMLVTAGGGGYGNPLERDPELVLEDVLDGYISEKAAREVYGVIIHNGKVNYEETKKLREQLILSKDYNKPC